MQNSWLTGPERMPVQSKGNLTRELGVPHLNYTPSAARAINTISLEVAERLVDMGFSDTPGFGCQLRSDLPEVVECGPNKLGCL